MSSITSTARSLITMRKLYFVLTSFLRQWHAHHGCIVDGRRLLLFVVASPRLASSSKADPVVGLRCTACSRSASLLRMRATSCSTRMLTASPPLALSSPTTAPATPASRSTLVRRSFDKATLVYHRSFSHIHPSVVSLSHCTFSLFKYAIILSHEFLHQFSFPGLPQHWYVLPCGLAGFPNFMEAVGSSE